MLSFYSLLSRWVHAEALLVLELGSVLAGFMYPKLGSDAHTLLAHWLETTDGGIGLASQQLIGGPRLMLGCEPMSVVGLGACLQYEPGLPCVLLTRSGAERLRRPAERWCLFAHACVTRQADRTERQQAAGAQFGSPMLKRQGVEEDPPAFEGKARERAVQKIAKASTQEFAKQFQGLVRLEDPRMPVKEAKEKKFSNVVHALCSVAIASAR